MAITISRPTRVPTTKTKPLRKFAWIRYMQSRHNYFIPDMSGFIDWRPLGEVKQPDNANFGGNWGFNNPYLLMQKPEDGETLPSLERIEWKKGVK